MPDGTHVIGEVQGGGQTCTPGMQQQGVCPLCPPGGQLIAAIDQFDISGSGQTGNVPVTRCRFVDDAGVYERINQITFPDPQRSDRTACSWSWPEHGGLPRPVVDLSRSQQSAPTLSGFAGAHGQIWFGAAVDAGFTQTVPLFLDQSPSSLIEIAIGPVQISAALTGTGEWGLEPTGVGYTLGLFSNQQIQILDQVSGERRWGVLSIGGTGEIVDGRQVNPGSFPPPVALLDSTRAGETPVHSAIAATSDGGALLLVSELDAFTVADVSAAHPGTDAGSSLATPAQLQTVLVPQPLIPIVSLAPVNPPRNGAFAEAYLLTPIEILHVTAATRSRWQLETLPPPNEPSDWLSLWAEGDRVRLGFTSGAVYSLPTRVQLSPVTPNGLPVSSYAQICTTTFALAGGSLYRLVPSPTSALGNWVDVTAEAGLSGVRSLMGGRIFWGSGALLVSSPFGEIYRMPIASGCAAP